MKRALTAFSLFTLTACAAPDSEPENAAQWRSLTGDAPLVIAHRGASGYLPEHTLEAYALAMEQGADVVEPDLVLTKDGVLVARHDRYLSTTTDVADHPEFADRKRANANPNGAPREDWWVDDFTLAELKTLRARQPFEGRSKEFDGLYEVPTFDEVIELVNRTNKETGRTVGIYPETKHPGYFLSAGLDFEAPLLSSLEAWVAGPVFIQSFEPEILKRLNGKTDATLVQLVYEATPGAGSNIPLQDISQYADAVGPSKNLLLPLEGGQSAFLKTAHDLKLHVHPWTFRDDVPNDVIDWSKAPSTTDLASSEIERELQLFFSYGVDGVFTDFPDTAVRVRSEMASQQD